MRVRIANKEIEMKKISTDGGFGSLMTDYMEGKAADENGFPSVSSFFDFIPIANVHILRENMQKSGRVVDSLPDGFLLGRVKQNKQDWAKTATAEKPTLRSKRLSAREKELRGVFLFYCDK